LIPNWFQSHGGCFISILVITGKFSFLKGFAALNQILLERKNKLICQISDEPLSHADQKVFARFCLPYIQLPYNIRFSTYSSNILYNNFNLVLKQTHSGTKTYQKLSYILVHKILFSIMCHTIVPWKRHNKIWSSKNLFS